MANLLVCVADRSAWRRELVTFPQLERLDADSILVVLDPHACVIAVIEDGATLELAHDIAHVLPRLGCQGDVASWAAAPRVLTPADVDVLRHELRLGISSLPDPPESLVDDAVVRELRAAVWRDPASDIARAIYADALQDRGDPRGELIALQLGRVRGAAPSDRERDLVRRYAARCADPLTPFLKSGYALRRGFLVDCVVDDKIEMPQEIVTHPAWSTVESIATGNLELLLSPTLVSPRRAGIGWTELHRLAAHSTPLPFEMIYSRPLGQPGKERVVVGVTASFVSQPPPAGANDWRGVVERGALAKLRVLAIETDTQDDRVPELLASELGARLRQLDVLTTADEPAFAAWRTAFDSSNFPLLTIRFWEGYRPMTWTTMDRLVALERTDRGTRVIVEVEQPLATDAARELVRIVSQLTVPGIRAVEVRDRGDPSRIVQRQPELYRLLAAVFPVIVMRDTPERSLAP